MALEPALALFCSTSAFAAGSQLDTHHIGPEPVPAGSPEHWRRQALDPQALTALLLGRSRGPPRERRAGREASAGRPPPPPPTPAGAVPALPAPAAPGAGAGALYPPMRVRLGWPCLAAGSGTAAAGGNPWNGTVRGRAQVRDDGRARARRATAGTEHPCR
ncbi:hypothetical protein GCM10009731_14100 [Streptomyces globosus]